MSRIIILVSMFLLTLPSFAAKKVKKGKVALVEYTSYTLEPQESSFKEGPARLLIQKNKDLNPFQKEILGLEVGESKKFLVEAKDAYGEYDTNKIHFIDKESVNLDGSKTHLRVGKYYKMRLKKQDGGSEIKEVKLMEITDENLVFDANHKYAGKDLYYEVRIKDVLDE